MSLLPTPHRRGDDREDPPDASQARAAGLDHRRRAGGVAGATGASRGADDDDDDPSTAYPLTSFPPSDSDNVVLQWNNEALECIRALRTPPVVNARALFIVHSAAYDAWAAYDAKAVGTRLRGTLRRPSAERTLANKRQAISHAAYRAASWVWPGCQADSGRPAGGPGLQHRRCHHRRQCGADGGRCGDRPPHRRRRQPGRQLRRHQRLHPGQPAAAGPAGRPLALAAADQHVGQHPALAPGDPVQPQHHPRHPGPNPAQVGVADRRQPPGRERRPRTTARRAWPCTGPTAPGQRPHPGTGT